MAFNIEDFNRRSMESCYAMYGIGTTLEDVPKELSDIAKEIEEDLKEAFEKEKSLFIIVEVRKSKYKTSK